MTNAINKFTAEISMFSDCGQTESSTFGSIEDAKSWLQKMEEEYQNYYKSERGMAWHKTARACIYQHVVDEDGVEQPAWMGIEIFRA